MKTYEELLACSDRERGEFCRKAVMEHESTSEYKTGLIANQYYMKRNPTIEAYKKIIYKVTGRPVEDTTSANFKLAKHSFRNHVISKTSYLLGNGVQLQDPEDKKRLGKNFDSQIKKAAKIAMVEGVSWTYWNNDHTEVYGRCATKHHSGFCPLISEETDKVTAGIRFQHYQYGNKRVTTYTLFEPEGVTEYKMVDSSDVEEFVPRRPYKTRVYSSVASGVIAEEGEGYDGEIPIVPLYTSDTYESELEGEREKYDAYALISSGLANNIDDAAEIMFLVKSAGVMDDVALAKLRQRIKNTRMASVDSEDGGDITPFEMNVPFEARMAMLEILRSDIYEDNMMMDLKQLTASQKTTQELQAAYQIQDDGSADFECFLYDYMDALLEIVGIDSEVTFKKNKVVNIQEQSVMILQWSNILRPETLIKHCPFLTPEEIEEEIKVLENEQIDRFFDESAEIEEPEEEEKEE